MWKWDLSAVGVDSAGDTRVDNWKSGVFFRSARTDLGSGKYHYRAMHFPPSASFVGGKLTLAFGTGERNEVLYEGNGSVDENNRLYVVQDLHPTGGSAFASVFTETNLTNVTSTAIYVNPGNVGYFIVGEEGEKFITDTIIFASHVLAASFKPSPWPTCGPGEAIFYAFRLGNSRGFFDLDGTPSASDRKMVVGVGVPSNPRMTLASDPTHDMIFMTTSEGQVLSIEPPLRDKPESSLLYWKQVF
jgi:hypothetical protein